MKLNTLNIEQLARLHRRGIRRARGIALKLQRKTYLPIGVATHLRAVARHYRELAIKTRNVAESRIRRDFHASLHLWVRGSEISEQQAKQSRSLVQSCALRG